MLVQILDECAKFTLRQEYDEWYGNVYQKLLREQISSLHIPIEIERIVSFMQKRYLNLFQRHAIYHHISYLLKRMAHTDAQRQYLYRFYNIMIHYEYKNPLHLAGTFPQSYRQGIYKVGFSYLCEETNLHLYVMLLEMHVAILSKECNNDVKLDLIEFLFRQDKLLKSIFTIYNLHSENVNWPTAVDYIILIMNHFLIIASDDGREQFNKYSVKFIKLFVILIENADTNVVVTLLDWMNYCSNHIDIEQSDSTEEEVLSLNDIEQVVSVISTLPIDDYYSTLYNFLSSVNLLLAHKFNIPNSAMMYLCEVYLKCEHIWWQECIIEMNKFLCNMINLNLHLNNGDFQLLVTEYLKKVIYSTSPHKVCTIDLMYILDMFLTDPYIYRDANLFRYFAVHSLNMSHEQDNCRVLYAYILMKWLNYSRIHNLEFEIIVKQYEELIFNNIKEYPEAVKSIQHTFLYTSLKDKCQLYIKENAQYFSNRYKLLDILPDTIIKF